MFFINRQKHSFKLNSCILLDRESKKKCTGRTNCKIYSLKLFGRAFGYGGDVLELVELRVSLSDEYLDRVRGGLLRQWSRLSVHIDGRHSDLVLVSRLQRAARAPRTNDSSLLVHRETLLAACSTVGVTQPIVKFHFRSNQ